MEWLRNAAAAAQTKAQEAAKQAQEKFKESGVVDKFAPVTTAASETKSLLTSLGSSLESTFNSQVGTEAKSGREGDVSFDKIGPPWVTSHLGLKPFEADIKASILKITEGTIDEIKERFLEKVTDDEFDFDFLEPSSTARAMAALDADDKLKAARHKLVPGKVKENDFWRCYFWKCDIIIQSYLKMCVADKNKRLSASGNRYPDSTDNVDFGADVSNGTALGFASDEIVTCGGDSAQTQAASSGLSWEEEMAKELEGIESGGGVPPASTASTASPASPSKHAAMLVSTSAGGKPAMDAKPAEFDEDDFEKELGL